MCTCLMTDSHKAFGFRTPDVFPLPVALESLRVEGCLHWLSSDQTIYKLAEGSVQCGGNMGNRGLCLF